MSNRLTIGINGRFQDYTGENGHGKAGQIKKASWLGKTISLKGKDASGQSSEMTLNRGSLIDYINANQASNAAPLKKGFLGIGGSSNEEVSKVFDQMISEKTKTFNSLSTSKKLAKLPIKTESSKQFSPNDKGAISLTQNSELSKNRREYIGTALLEENDQWILHICVGGGNPVVDSEEDFASFMAEVPKALDRINEQRTEKIQPDAICIWARRIKNLPKLCEAWQKNL